ncbi:MAG: glycosyltransferase [Caldimicrobium sp.]
MRVLQVARFYPPYVGGTERIIREITEGLNKRGIKCDVLCANTSYEYREEHEKGFIIYRVKSLGSFASTPLSPQFITKFKEIAENYDIIHFHHANPVGNLAYLLTKPKKPRLIIHYHFDIVRQKILYLFYKPFLLRLLEESFAIVVTSPYYAEGSQILNKFRDKLMVIPLGIEKKLKIDPEKVKIIRERFKERKIIFSLGRLVYYKGFEYLIEAAHYLGEDYVILIGGEGPLEGKLKNLAEKVKGNILFLGKIPEAELGNFYEACDLFCLPSVERTEAFGVVILEAFSFGKPVVATNIPFSGVSWVNVHGKTGLNVEPKNPKALAEAIKKILEDEKLYKEFSKNAYQRWRKYFTVEKMVEEIIRLYQKVLEPQRKGL